MRFLFRSGDKLESNLIPGEEFITSIQGDCVSETRDEVTLTNIQFKIRGEWYPKVPITEELRLPKYSEAPTGSLDS